MAGPKLQVTKNYRLFERSADNRPTDIARRKALRASMKKYGFLSCFPIAVFRNSAGRLVVRDGQHRLAIAEELVLSVWYVIESQDFNTSIVAKGVIPWRPRDHAEMYAAQGKEAYINTLAFADKYNLPVATAFALAAGTVVFHNVYDEFYSGAFKVKDQQWAETVGAIYSQIIGRAPKLRNARLIEACMAVGRLKDFDPQRLITGLDRCREKLIPYATRDSYLDMLEDVYNFGRKNLVPLKISAVQAMRDRNVVKSKNGRTGKSTKAASNQQEVA